MKYNFVKELFLLTVLLFGTFWTGIVSAQGTERPSFDWESYTYEELNEPETVADNPFTPITNIKITLSTDYAHVRDMMFLGYNESLSVTLNVMPVSALAEDIILLFDEESLVTTWDEVIQTTTSDSLTLKFKVTALKPGRHEFYVCSAYDLVEYGEEAECQYFSIEALDETNGRVVYFTPYGKRYHYSYECAGENGTPTTLRDAQLIELGPCRVCAH